MSEIEHRRWPKLVGGTNDNIEVPDYAWVRGRLRALKSFSMAVHWAGDQHPGRPVEYEEEEYERRSIGVGGGASVVVDAMVLRGMADADVISTIWLRLLTAAGVTE